MARLTAGGVGQNLLDLAKRTKSGSGGARRSDSHFPHRAWIPDIDDGLYTRVRKKDTEAVDEFTRLVPPVWFFATPPTEYGEPETPMWDTVYEMNTRWNKCRGLQGNPKYWISNVPIVPTRTIVLPNGEWKTVKVKDPALDLFTTTNDDGETVQSYPRATMMGCALDVDDRPILVPFNTVEFKMLTKWILDQRDSSDDLKWGIDGVPLRVFNTGKRREKVLNIRLADDFPTKDMSKHVPVDIGEYTTLVRDGFTAWAAGQGVDVPPPPEDDEPEPEPKKRFLAGDLIDAAKSAPDMELEHGAGAAALNKIAAETVPSEAAPAGGHSDLSLEELRVRAKEQGLRHSDRTSKARLIKMLDAVNS